MKFFSKTMKLNNIDTIPYLTYNSLSEISFINHAFTTRLGGVSTGEFTSMNMAFNRGDNPDSVFIGIIEGSGGAVAKHDLILVNGIFEAEILTAKTGNAEHLALVKRAANTALGAVGLGVAQSIATGGCGTADFFGRGGKA